MTEHLKPEQQQASDRLIPPAEYCAKRKAQLEAEVTAGKRDARSLVAIPADLAKRAVVVFPEDAFGRPQDW